MIMQTTLKGTKRSLPSNLPNYPLSQYRTLDIIEFLLNTFETSLFDITSAFEIDGKVGIETL